MATTLTAPRRRRGATFWLGRTLLAALALILGLVLGAIALEELITARDRRAFPPPGQLVEVSGYRLHLHVAGEARGLPTVILEHGGMAMSAQWGWLQPALAEHTRVVAYDRPGMGWSDAGPVDQDPRQLVDDLRRALNAAGVEGPYLLVGHSMGGLLSRLFAATYPDEVAGVVLVDPRDVTQAWIYSDEELAAYEEVIGLYGLAGRLGVLRWNSANTEAFADLPPQQRAEAAALSLSYRHLRGARAEWELGNRAAEAVARADVPPTTPLLVLSASEAGGAYDERQRAALTAQHAQLALRSPHWEHRELEGADHVTVVTKFEHAQVVGAAVQKLLVRSGEGRPVVP